jgi:hypothetical protein
VASELSLDVGLAKQWFVNVIRSPLQDKMKKFIFEQVNCPSEARMPTSDQPALRHSLQNVVLSGLLQCCPFPRTREMLSSQFSIQLPLLQQLTFRRSQLFGIHIVAIGTDRLLSDAGIHVEMVDFTTEALHGNFDCASCYHRLLDRFSDTGCFVYVVGLRRVEDQFLKWCAEYTERCPWRFILFESADIRYNLAENRDRCTIDPKLVVDAGSAALKQTHVKFHSMEAMSKKIQEQKLFNCVRAEFQLDCAMRSFYLCKWREKVESIISPASSGHADGVAEPVSLLDVGGSAQSPLLRVPNFLLLIVSPPGAGKTHFMNNRVKPKVSLCRSCGNSESCSSR